MTEAPKTGRYTDKDYALMITEIDQRGEGLTDWEIGFISDLIERVWRTRL